MNLGEFHSEVSSFLKRGTALDSVIPTFVRQAARFLERNYNFLYMERFVETTVVAGDRYIILPSTRVKQVNFFRWRDGEGEFSYLRTVNPKDQLAWGDVRPSGYWRDGSVGLVLDSVTDATLEGELQIVEMTDWPTNPNSEHWLIDNAEDVLLAQSMMIAATSQRDTAMYQVYLNARNEGLKTIIDSDIEARFSNSDQVMQYSPGA